MNMEKSGERRYTLGIIGGMGPMATVDLFARLVGHTAASCDGEHIHIVIDNDPTIPDRTKALLGQGESPVGAIVRSAVRLANAGAELLLLPCHTSHAYYDEIAAAAPVPILNMVRETVKVVAERGHRRVGLLATGGTLLAGVYEKAFAVYGTECVVPTPTEQESVMSLIYDGVKAGRHDYDTTAFVNTLDAMKRRGAEVFILGCTELPIAVKDYEIPGRFIDPTLILTKAAILRAGYSFKESE